MRVSVIGGGRIDDEQYGVARTVGRLLGERGHDVVCGGLGGAMEAACRGAVEAGGHTLGLLPGEDRGAANPHVETAVATGMGNARNVLVALNGDAAIAVHGATGTLSEVGHALDFGRPVAAIGGPDLSRFPGFETAESPEAAVEYVESAVAGRSRG